MEVILLTIFGAAIAAAAPVILALNARITAQAAAKLALAAAGDARTASEQSTQTNVTLAGNGKGDMIHMLEHLVKWTETHDQRHVLIDTQVDRLQGVNQFLTRGTLRPEGSA
jgi:hypothetical protein